MELQRRLPVLLIMLWITAPSITSAQSNGDIRLVGGSDESNGRLEIFWNGQWGTICGSDNSKFTRGAAQAACRQLGFLDQLGSGSLNRLNYTQTDNNTSVVIGSVDCPYSFSEGKQHILRCDISDTVDTIACTHDVDVGIQCDPTSLWEHPYHTQVRLDSSSSSSYSSSGVLEMYIDGRWGNVCFSKFNEHAADSACRQMGYTNALSYSASSEFSQSLVWLDGVECNADTSCPCLNQCFNIPSYPTSCSENTYVYIQCTFDLSLKETAVAGSHKLCADNPGYCGDKTDIYLLAVAASVTIIAFVLLALGIVVCVTLVACCCLPMCHLFRWKQRFIAGYRHPTSEDTTSDQANVAFRGRAPKIVITPSTPLETSREFNHVPSLK